MLPSFLSISIALCPQLITSALKQYGEAGKVHVNASKLSFQKNEAHFSEAIFLDDLVEDGRLC